MGSVSWKAPAWISSSFPWLPRNMHDTPCIELLLTLLVKFRNTQLLKHGFEHSMRSSAKKSA